MAPKAYPVFNPAVGRYFGGAEVDLYYLARELARDSAYECSFLVADYGQEEVEVREGVRVIRTLDFRRPLGGVGRIWRGLKLAEPDICFTKTFSAGVAVLAHYCRSHGRRFVYRTASSKECDGSYVKSHPLTALAFLWALRRADLLVAQNRGDADSLRRTYGLDAVVLPNGHPVPPPAETKRDCVLWAGRDAAVKRPGRFLELARAVPGERFVMVCQTLRDDRAYAELRREAAGLANVEFLPHVPFDRIGEYFARAKVFVNTSDTEGFPNTFIQACAAGTPIVSYRIDPDEFLARHGCGLCAGGDMRRMAEMLAGLLADEAAAAEMGRNGRRYFEEHHDIVRIAERYKELFARLEGHRP